MNHCRGSRKRAHDNSLFKGCRLCRRPFSFCWAQCDHATMRWTCCQKKAAREAKAWHRQFSLFSLQAERRKLLFHDRQLSAICGFASTSFSWTGTHCNIRNLSHFYSHCLALFEVSGFVFAPSSCPESCRNIRVVSVPSAWPEALCSIRPCFGASPLVGSPPQYPALSQLCVANVDV